MAAENGAFVPFELRMELTNTGEAVSGLTKVQNAASKTANLVNRISNSAVQFSKIVGQAAHTAQQAFQQTSNRLRLLQNGMDSATQAARVLAQNLNALGRVTGSDIGISKFSQLNNTLSKTQSLARTGTDAFSGFGRSAEMAGMAGSNAMARLSANTVTAVAGIATLTRFLQSATQQMERMDILRASYQRIMSARPDMQNTSAIDNTVSTFWSHSKRLAYEYGVAIDDVAGTMIEFARQGHSPQVVQYLTKELAELRLMLATSTGSLVDMRSAMGSVITMMNQMGVTAYDAVSGLKLMTEYDIRTATSFSNLSTAINKFAAAGKVAGMTQSEMIKVATAFTEIGIQGNRAGTALNTIIARVANTKKAKEMLTQLGVSLTTFEDGAVRATSTFEQLVEAYKKVKATGNKDLLQLFGYNMAGARMQSVLFAGLEQYVKQTRANVTPEQFSRVASSFETQLKRTLDGLTLKVNPQANIEGLDLNEAEIKRKLLSRVGPLMDEFRREFETRGEVTSPNDVSLMQRLLGDANPETAAKLVSVYSEAFQTIRSEFDQFFSSIESTYANIERLAMGESKELQDARKKALDTMRNTAQNQYVRAQNAFQSNFLDPAAIERYTKVMEYAVTLFGNLGSVLSTTISTLTLGGTALWPIMKGLELFLGTSILNMFRSVGEAGANAFSSVGSAISNVVTDAADSFDSLFRSFSKDNTERATGGIADRITAAIGTEAKRVARWQDIVGDTVDKDTLETIPGIITRFKEAATATQVASESINELAVQVRQAATDLDGLLVPTDVLIRKVDDTATKTDVAAQMWKYYADSINGAVVALDALRDAYNATGGSFAPPSILNNSLASGVKVYSEGLQQAQRDAIEATRTQNTLTDSLLHVANTASKLSTDLSGTAKSIKNAFDTPITDKFLEQLKIAESAVGRMNDTLPAYLQKDILGYMRNTKEETRVLPYDSMFVSDDIAREVGAVYEYMINAPRMKGSINKKLQDNSKRRADLLDSIALWTQVDETTAKRKGDVRKGIPFGDTTKTVAEVRKMWDAYKEGQAVLTDLYIAAEHTRKQLQELTIQVAETSVGSAKKTKFWKDLVQEYKGQYGDKKGKYDSYSNLTNLLETALESREAQYSEARSKFMNSEAVDNIRKLKIADEDRLADLLDYDFNRFMSKYGAKEAKIINEIAKQNLRITEDQLKELQDSEGSMRADLEKYSLGNTRELLGFEKEGFADAEKALDEFIKNGGTHLVQGNRNMEDFVRRQVQLLHKLGDDTKAANLQNIFDFISTEGGTIHENASNAKGLIERMLRGKVGDTVYSELVGKSMLGSPGMPIKRKGENGEIIEDTLKEQMDTAASLYNLLPEFVPIIKEITNLQKGATLLNFEEGTKEMEDAKTASMQFADALKRIQFASSEAEAALKLLTIGTEEYDTAQGKVNEWKALERTVNDNILSLQKGMAEPYTMYRGELDALMSAASNVSQRMAQTIVPLTEARRDVLSNLASARTVPSLSRDESGKLISADRTAYSGAFERLREKAAARVKEFTLSDEEFNALSEEGKEYVRKGLAVFAELEAKFDTYLHEVVNALSNDFVDAGFVGEQAARAAQGESVMAALSKYTPKSQGVDLREEAKKGMILSPESNPKEWDAFKNDVSDTSQTLLGLEFISKRANEELARLPETATSERSKLEGLIATVDKLTASLTNAQSAVEAVNNGLASTVTFEQAATMRNDASVAKYLVKNGVDFLDEGMKSVLSDFNDMLQSRLDRSDIKAGVVTNQGSIMESSEPGLVTRLLDTYREMSAEKDKAGKPLHTQEELDNVLKMASAVSDETEKIRTLQKELRALNDEGILPKDGIIDLFQRMRTAMDSYDLVASKAEPFANITFDSDMSNAISQLIKNADEATPSLDSLLGVIDKIRAVLNDPNATVTKNFLENAHMDAKELTELLAQAETQLTSTKNALVGYMSAANKTTTAVGPDGKQYTRQVGTTATRQKQMVDLGNATINTASQSVGRLGEMLTGTVNRSDVEARLGVQNISTAIQEVNKGLSNSADLVNKFSNAFNSIKKNPELRDQIADLNKYAGTIKKTGEDLLPIMEKAAKGVELAQPEVEKLVNDFKSFKDAQKSVEDLGNSMHLLVSDRIRAIGQSIQGWVTKIFNVYATFNQIVMLATTLAHWIGILRDYTEEWSLGLSGVEEGYEAVARAQKVTMEGQQKSLQSKEQEENLLGKTRTDLHAVSGNKSLTTLLTNRFNVSEEELLRGFDSYDTYLQTYWEEANKLMQEGKDIFKVSPFKSLYDFLGEQFNIDKEALEELAKQANEYIKTFKGIDFSEQLGSLSSFLQQRVADALSYSSDIANQEKTLSELSEKSANAVATSLRKTVENGITQAKALADGMYVYDPEEAEKQAEENIKAFWKSWYEGLAEAGKSQNRVRAAVENALVDNQGNRLLDKEGKEVTIDTASVDQLADAFYRVVKDTKDETLMGQILEFLRSLDTYLKKGSTLPTGVHGIKGENAGVDATLISKGKTLASMDKSKSYQEQLSTTIDKFDKEAVNNARLQRNRSQYAEIKKSEESIEDLEHEMDMAKAKKDMKAYNEASKKYQTQIETYARRLKENMEEFEKILNDLEGKLYSELLDKVFDMDLPEGAKTWADVKKQVDSILDDMSKYTEGTTTDPIETARKLKDLMSTFKTTKDKAYEELGEGEKIAQAAEEEAQSYREQAAKEKNEDEVKRLNGLADEAKQRADEAREKAKEAFDTTMKTATDAFAKGINEIFSSVNILGKQMILKFIDIINGNIDAVNESNKGLNIPRLKLNESNLAAANEAVQQETGNPNAKYTPKPAPKTPPATKQEATATQIDVGTKVNAAKSKVDEESDAIKTLRRERDGYKKEAEKWKERALRAEKNRATANSAKGKDPNKEALAELLNEFSEELDMLKFAYQTVEDEEGNIIKYLDRTGTYEYMEERIKKMREQRKRLADFINNHNLAPQERRKAEKALRNLDLGVVKLELDLDMKKWNEAKNKLEFDKKILQKQITIGIDTMGFDEVESIMDRIWKITTEIYKKELEITTDPIARQKIELQHILDELEHQSDVYQKNLNIYKKLVDLHTKNNIGSLSQSYASLFKQNIDIYFSKNSQQAINRAMESYGDIMSNSMNYITQQMTLLVGSTKSKVEEVTGNKNYDDETKKLALANIQKATDESVEYLMKQVLGAASESLENVNVPNLAAGDYIDFDKLVSSMGLDDYIEGSLGRLRPITAERAEEAMAAIDAIEAAFVNFFLEQLSNLLLQNPEYKENQDKYDTKMNEARANFKEMFRNTLGKKLKDKVEQSYEQYVETIVEAFQSNWDSGFDIGLEYGFSSEGWQKLGEHIKKLVVSNLSNYLKEQITQTLKKSLTDGLTNATKSAVLKSKFGTQFLVPTLSGIIGSVIGFALGALFNGLFSDITDAIEQQAEEQLKQQRDQINAQGFSWSYSRDNTSTPYYEFSPPVTQESIKVVKFSSTFNITTDAAMAMASHRRELERVCAEIIEAYNRNAAKTVGASI